MRLWLALLVVGLGLAAPVHADIYTFTDADGVTHYTNVPTDPRFELLAREPVPERGLGAAQAIRAGTWRSRAVQYEGLIDRTAAGTEVQPALLRAVIVVESAFNPRAVSRAGAKGLMQLLPSTARRYGVEDSFDAAQNVAGGARYLRDLLKRYDNNLELVLAAYNAGEDAVDRHGGRVPPYRETRAYVPAVLKWYRQFQSPTTGG